MDGWGGHNKRSKEKRGWRKKEDGGCQPSNSGRPVKTWDTRRRSWFIRTEGGNIGAKSKSVGGRRWGGWPNRLE